MLCGSPIYFFKRLSFHLLLMYLGLRFDFFFYFINMFHLHLKKYVCTCDACQVVQQMSLAEILVVTKNVQKKWSKRFETMDVAIESLPANAAKDYIADTWYPTCYTMFPHYVKHASQLPSKECPTIEASAELQQILAAGIVVPQALMKACNLFALVTAQCDTMARSEAYLKIQNRIEVEESEFMSKIASLVEQWGVEWDYICNYDT